MSIFSNLKKNKPAAEATPVAATKVPKAKPAVKAEVKPAEKPASQPLIIPEPKADHSVIVRPIISEKAAHLHTVHQYVFEVRPGANKILVKKALKGIYNVDVIKVAMIKVKGKSVQRTKTRGRTSDYKKAIVTLKKGQTIKVYEGV